ncbi:putative alkylhydroperoxidase AhpD family core domain protein, partial [Mycobacterium tuberculosis SUMu002]
MKFVNHIEPVAPRRAGGAVAEVYAEARREFGRLPEPLAMLSPDEGLLTAGWATLRETLLVGQVPRGRKEAVAAAVAASLRCPWCVDAHTTMLYAAGQTDTAAAILAGTAPAAGDPNAPYVAWAAGTGTPAGPPAPFGPDVAAEYLGTAVQFHFIARLVLVLLDETFLPGGPARPTAHAPRRWTGVRPQGARGASAGPLHPPARAANAARRSGMGNTVRAHSNRVRRAQPPPGHRAAPAATDSSGGQAGRGVVARRANADEQSLDERAHRRAARRPARAHPSCPADRPGPASGDRRRRRRGPIPARHRCGAGWRPGLGRLHRRAAHRHLDRRRRRGPGVAAKPDWVSVRALSVGCHRWPEG